MHADELSCDVLIIGAGMAGACLARQLRLAWPELYIVNIDRRKSFDYWIGESTVEAWEDYARRVLGLGELLDRCFREKHGLRMFFDSPEADLSLAEMSEFGRSAWLPIPARHLDRSVFDTELARINRESGVDVRLGVAVEHMGITLDKEAGHTVRTSAGTIRCRYLVDAAGRSSPLARQLGLIQKDERHPSVSYWARIRGVRQLDSLGDGAWTERVNGTPRWASTNHFLYKGYWFWHISLSEDLVSIGIEFDRSRHELPVRGADAFMSFLREHRCLDEILGPDAELVDYGALTSLRRLASPCFTEDRWYLTGMSGFFAEVMGSGTSRIYAEMNRMVGALVEADRAGEDERVRRRAAAFNAHVRNTYEAFHENLSRYEWFGSFDLFSNYFGVGLGNYFNSQLPRNMQDLDDLFAYADALEKPELADEDFERSRRRSLRAATAALAGEFYEFLEASGSYHANNRGCYADSLDWEAREAIVSKLGAPRCKESETRVARALWRSYVERLLTRMCEIEGHSFSEAAFEESFATCWTQGQSLGELLERQRA